MPLGTSLPYGLRDVNLKNFTDPAWTTVGTGIDLPYSRTFSFSESEDFEELRGDDTVITTRGKGPAIEWELEAGGLNMAAYARIAGGVVTASGTTPAQKNLYRKLQNDSRPYFKVEGQAISDSGGDVHGIVYRARCTGSIEGAFGDGNFFLTKASGKGLGSFESANLGALYDFVQNETAVTIT